MLPSTGAMSTFRPPPAAALEAQVSLYASTDAVRADGASVDSVDVWLEPIPLGAPPPDPIPLDVMPDVLRAHVESVAAATQTPSCMGAMLARAAVSAAIRGRGDVVVDARGWRERVCLYVDVILPSGARKSPVYDAMTAPIRAWEAAAAEYVAPDRARALDTVAVRRRELDAAIRGGEMPAVDAARIALTDAEASVPAVPRIVMSDATPEALAREMAVQGGAISLLAPEGDPLRIADGRYSRDGGARTGELLRAWTGETIRVDRVGRDPVHVPHPALTIAITMQPGVIESLAHAREMRSVGAWARMLWVVPDAGLGRRATGADVPRLDADAAQAYTDMVTAIVANPRPVSDAVTLRLSRHALDAVYAAEAEVEALMHPDRDDGIADWTAKLCGQAIRIAACDAIADRAVHGEPPWAAPIGEDAMRGGIETAWALRTHALVVLGARRADELAEYVLGRARELLDDARTIRQLYQLCHGRAAIETVEDLEDVLRRLERRHHLRIVPRPSRGGRPPSPLIELHPVYLAGTTARI